MTRKYTAADFANARLAEHPESGKVAAKVHPYGFPEDDEPREWESRDGYLTNSDMARDGWVPVPTKPTITKSRFDKEFDPQWRWNVVEIQQKLEKLGIEIIPDPEPTNAQKLEQLLWAINKEHEGEYLEGEDAIRAWAEALDEAGITAPNVKDN